MNTSPSFDIAGILERLEFGKLGIDLFATKEIPAKPDKITFIMNTGTYEDPSVNLTYRYPMVQVVARGAAGEFGECTNRMYVVDEMLHGLNDVYINENRYVYIYRITEPVDLDYDDTMRPFIGANYRLNMVRGVPNPDFESGIDFDSEVRKSALYKRKRLKKEWR